MTSDVAHWTCPKCGEAVESEYVVDETFITRVNQHKAKHVNTSAYVVVHDGFGYDAAFCLAENGDLLETVEFEFAGIPDWSAAGVCDERRGSNPWLQRGVRTTLLDLSE